MKNVFIFLSLFLLSGCSSIYVEKTKNGVDKKCSARYISMFKDISKMNMNACDASGSVANSASDEAIFEAAIKILEKYSLK
jgi:hypothetical protein